MQHVNARPSTFSICKALTGEIPFNFIQRNCAPFLPHLLPPFQPLTLLPPLIRYDGGNVHSVQPPAQRQDRSYAITADILMRDADCCHPYWRNHGRQHTPYAQHHFGFVDYFQVCFGMWVLMEAHSLRRARMSKY
jgi:hypothetical protein